MCISTHCKASQSFVIGIQQLINKVKICEIVHCSEILYKNIRLETTYTFMWIGDLKSRNFNNSLYHKKIILFVGNHDYQPS